MAQRIAVAVTYLALAVLVAAPSGAQTTARVSLAPGGGQANWDSSSPAISADGRRVAYVSGARNIVTGGLGVNDVYVYDRQTGLTSCVSVSSAGARGNGDSDSPAISADGRYVAFRSYATNFVTGDTNGYEDVFLRDTVSSVTRLVSRTAGGLPGNGPSGSPVITADGGVVAFASFSSDLMAGDTNSSRDVFAFALAASQMTVVSVAFDGAPANGSSVGPAISADGRYVAFASVASNIVLGDSNYASDIFLHDRATRQSTRVSVSSTGLQANDESDEAAISGDGRVVAFRSYASNLAPLDTNGVSDVFAYSTTSRETGIVSAGAIGPESNGASMLPAVSVDGRYVAFLSRGFNLVSGDTNGWEDVFVRDLRTAHTVRVSLGDFWSDGLSITPDAAGVAFASYADNLVPGDTNGVSDVFVRGPYATGIGPGDVQTALRIATGLWTATSADMLRLNVDKTGASASRVDLNDAVYLVRKITGLEP